MLFLVTPPRQVFWSDFPSNTIALAKKHGGTLEGIPWSPTEEPHNFTRDLEVALRYGAPHSRGIIVPGTEVVAASGHERFARLQAEIRAKKAELKAWNEAQDAMMERIIPGWTAEGERLDREIERGSEEHYARAVEEAAEVLARPRAKELEEHWVSIGGHLPT